MAVILAGVTLVGASPAKAQSLTAPGEASVDEVTDLLYAGGTTTTRPTPSDPALVESWRAKELALRSEAGPLSSAGPELEKLRRWGKVKWGFRILGKASLVATAGQVGWEIGSIIADEIYEEDLPAAAELTGWDPAYSQLMAVQKGDCIAFVDTTQPPTLAGMSDADARTACSGGPGLPDSTEDSSKLRAPADGWVLILREAGGFRDYYTVQFGPGAEGLLRDRLKPGYSPWDIHSCNEITHPLTAAAPAGFQLLGAVKPSGAPWYGNYQNTATCLLEAVSPEVISGRPYVWFKPATGVSRPVAPGEDPPGQPLNGDVPDPGRSNVEQAVRDNLCDPGYEKVANFIAQQVASAVCDWQVQLPDCSGQTVSQCVDALDARGLTNFRVADAPTEQGDPAIAPGDAVGTDPFSGSWVDPSDEVVVRRNPQPPITDSANPQDASCEVATRFDTGKMDPWELVPPQFVFFGKDETGDDVTIPLRYGNPYQNWGYRHIANEHGWDETVAEQTAIAIEADESAHSGVKRRPDGSLLYWHFFVHPETGEQCTQRVVARDSPVDGQPEALGIITSFAARGWQEPTI